MARQDSARRGNNNLGLYIALGLAALVIIATFAAYFSGHSRDKLAIGRKAPDITVTDQQGRRVALSSIEGPVLLAFWQTTCPACQAEMQALETIWTQESKDGPPRWTLVLVNLGESPDAVRAFTDHYKLTFPVYLDPTGAAAETYAVYYIPANFFLDGSHRIRSRSEGGLGGPAIKTRLNAISR